MADTMQGIVEKITEKKTAKGLFFSINVEGDWFGFGKEAPEFGEGSEVFFEISVNGDFENVDNDTLNIIDNQNPPAKKSSGRSGGSRGSSNKSSGRSGGSTRSGRGGGTPDKSAGSGRSGGSKPASGGKADVDWDLKDMKIQWQSSRNAAIALAEVAISCEALVLPAKKADKLDALEAWVSEKTQEFFLDIQEERWTEAE